jgi:hypothetical protein
MTVSVPFVPIFPGAAGPVQAQAPLSYRDNVLKLSFGFPQVFSQFGNVVDVCSVPSVRSTCVECAYDGFGPCSRL